MIDEMETLLALRREGSTERAANALRITQSAVSKRLASLEEKSAAPLFERKGRRLALTPAGERLAASVAPLLGALREALAAGEPPPSKELVLAMGVTESVLASFGGPLLREALARCPGTRLELHAHRGPVCIERVRAGTLDLALVAGSVSREGELKTVDLGVEEMLLVVPPEQAPRLERGVRVLVWTIEARSATWRSLERPLRVFEKSTGIDLRPEHRLESFAPLVALARAGFGVALAPARLVEAMGLRAPLVHRLPLPRVHRPIRLVSRRRSAERPGVARLVAALAEAAPHHLAGQVR